MVAGIMIDLCQALYLFLLWFVKWSIIPILQKGEVSLCFSYPCSILIDHPGTRSSFMSVPVWLPYLKSSFPPSWLLKFYLLLNLSRLHPSWTLPTSSPPGLGKGSYLSCLWTSITLHFPARVRTPRSRSFLISVTLGTPHTVHSTTHPSLIINKSSFLSGDFWPNWFVLETLNMTTKWWYWVDDSAIFFFFLKKWVASTLFMFFILHCYSTVEAALLIRLKVIVLLFSFQIFLRNISRALSDNTHSSILG